MSCESENWQAKAAFSDLIDTIKLWATEMDYVETDYEAEPSCTRKKVELLKRLNVCEEVYDRLCDLSEMVNVPENEPVKDNECKDDDCDCHQ